MAVQVLIVEDNPTNMKLFVDLLTATGYEAIQARDAETALVLLETLQPNVIIMDIQLPGMSGMECAQHIKGTPHLSHIPIIAVTAFALFGDEARFRAAGCDDYLSKPISVTVLLDMVAQHAGEPEKRNQNFAAV